MTRFRRFAIVLLILAGLGSPSFAEQLPPGWTRGGSRPDHYTAGATEEGCRQGGRCGYLRSSRDDPEGFSALVQSFEAKPHLGRRLRMTGWIRTADVEKWAALWMRVDGHGEVLAFDNMQGRPLTGTTDWQAVEVVLDVAPEADSVWFGCLLMGSGRIWVDDFNFEQVGPEVPTTDMTQPPESPSNLGFEDR